MPRGDRTPQPAHRDRRCRLFILTAAFFFLAVPASAQKAIDFALRDLDGNTVRLSDHIGEKVILVDFWATWCVPCVKELPHFQRFHETYADKGLLILAITVDGPETVAMVRPFMSRYNYTFPVLLDTESRVIALYNPRVVLPYHILIDRQGNIRHTHTGYSPGDEIVLEQRIRALLEPEDESRIRPFSFHASEAFLNRNFSDREYVDRIRGGRTSQIINQLDLTLSRGAFLAGARLDANLDFSPWQDKVSLAKRFLEFNTRSLSVRAGDFYHTVGRGLAFSVLKTFEKEGLEYIIDTTVDGGKLAFSHKDYSAELFGGWLDREDSDLKDRVLGGALGRRIGGLVDVKAQIVHADLERGSFFNTERATMESLSLDLPNFRDKLKFFGEFLLLQKKMHYVEDTVRGHGLYLESGLFLKNLTFLLEFKDYKNLDFEYNRPPLLEPELVAILANQFAVSSKNVTAIAGRVDYYFPKRSLLAFGRYAHFRDAPVTQPRTIHHAFLGLEKKFGETGWVNVLGGFRREETESLVFYYTHGDTWHGQANVSFPLTSRLSLEAYLEAKTFDGRHFDYRETRSSFSVHRSPWIVLTLFYDRSTDPEVLFFKNKKDWWGSQIELKLSRWGNVKMFYGAIKGGVKCAGGACKFFPPFEGLRIDLLFRL